MLTIYIFLFILLYTPTIHSFIFHVLLAPCQSLSYIFYYYSYHPLLTPSHPLLTLFHIPSHIFIAPWFFVKKGAQECFQWNTDFQKARKEYLSRSDSLSSTLPLLHSHSFHLPLPATLLPPRSPSLSHKLIFHSRGRDL